ncbi:SOS response-associated peptidase [Methylomicrobium lacus]|uniref:SOS response-associated peptidase n=1 Tax=Methylomicrobium lacus TaxID=136992 RepID=UPI0035A8B7B7
MCSRFALYSDPSKLAHRFSAEAAPSLIPQFNVSPTQTILLVREENDRRRFAQARWGLVPRWAKEKDIGYPAINARAETVANKAIFRDAYRRRRCLIPADGFYAWQAVPDSKAKQPWFIVLRSRLPMALAGLWEQWRSPKGELMKSCAIIVAAANELMRPIQNQMPVILAAEHWNDWLGLATHDAKFLQIFLKSYPDDDMSAWPVSTKVNNPQKDSEECIEAVK